MKKHFLTIDGFDSNKSVTDNVRRFCRPRLIRFREIESEPYIMYGQKWYRVVAEPHPENANIKNCHYLYMMDD